MRKISYSVGIHDSIPTLHSDVSWDAGYSWDTGNLLRHWLFLGRWLFLGQADTGIHNLLSRAAAVFVAILALRNMSATPRALQRVLGSLQWLAAPHSFCWTVACPILSISVQLFASLQPHFSHLPVVFLADCVVSLVIADSPSARTTAIHNAPLLLRCSTMWPIFHRLVLPAWQLRHYLSHPELGGLTTRRGDVWRLSYRSAGTEDGRESLHRGGAEHGQFKAG